MTVKICMFVLGVVFVANFVRAASSMEVFDCGFGDGIGNGPCGLMNEFSSGGLEWKLVQHAGERCMMVNSEGLQGGLIARLGSRDLPLTTYKNGCLRFRFQMEGESIGLFHVIVETFNMTSFSINRWYTHGMKSREWIAHYIDLSKDTHIDIQTKLIFDVTTMLSQQPMQPGLVRLDGIILSLRDNCAVIQDYDRRGEEYPPASDVVITSPAPTISILEQPPEVQINVSQGGVQGELDILADIAENNGNVDKLDKLEEKQEIVGDRDLELGIQVDLGKQN